MENLTAREIILKARAGLIFGKIELAHRVETIKKSFHEDGGHLFFWFKSGNHNHVLSMPTADLDAVLNLRDVRVVMCCACKKVRGDNGAWLENPGITSETHSEISHGICPICLDDHYPEISARMREGEAVPCL